MSPKTGPVLLIMVTRIGDIECSAINGLFCFSVARRGTLFLPFPPTRCGNKKLGFIAGFRTAREVSSECSVLIGVSTDVRNSRFDVFDVRNPVGVVISFLPKVLKFATSEYSTNRTACFCV